MNSPYDKYTIPIRKGEPISELGLTFYPVTMEHYERFLMCKDALCLRQSSLPVRYVAMDFTTALFTLEMDTLSVPEAEHSGAFYKLLQFLYLVAVGYAGCGLEKQPYVFAIGKRH